MIVDPSRFIAYANPAVEQVLGYRPEEVVDRPLALFVHGSDDLERIADALQPSSPVRNHDLEVRRRDGTAVCVSVSASLAAASRTGGTAAPIAYLRDVTERRHAEEALARKNAELEHYVHAVSHDLRSPLVSLLGFTRLLRDGLRRHARGQGAPLPGADRAGRADDGGADPRPPRAVADRPHRPRHGRVSPRAVLLQLAAELKPRLDAPGRRAPDLPRIRPRSCASAPGSTRSSAT